ncbi:RND transporter MFP subunit [Pandoraea anapnoica]|uniref:RND transporter MFP subunit n=1 Tax=Pandoraea anapnoica TaxID=2508301 RepID=A0A5E5ACC5_9BURK|nr:RND transporter MFP subunit [Pandoraea anapnoica]
MNDVVIHDDGLGVSVLLYTSTGMVMLVHGAMSNIAMPAITMAYKAKDAAMAKSVHAGDKVRVRVENVGGTLTIVRMDKYA